MRADGRRRRRREVKATPGSWSVTNAEPGSAASAFAPNVFAYHACISRVLLAEEVHVVQLNRRLLILHFDELDLHVFRSERERDVRRRARGGDVVRDLDRRRHRVRR